MAYTTLPQAGLIFNQAYAIATAVTATSGMESPSPPWAVGTTQAGSDHTEWVFCKAGGTITAGDWVVLTSATFVADALTSTNGLLAVGQWVGVAGASCVVNQFIWVCRKGYLSSANVATSATANAFFSTTSTAGRVSTTATANTTAVMSGAIGNATAASNTAPVTLNYPQLRIANP